MSPNGAMMAGSLLELVKSSVGEGAAEVRELKGGKVEAQVEAAALVEALRKLKEAGFRLAYIAACLREERPLVRYLLAGREGIVILAAEGWKLDSSSGVYPAAAVYEAETASLLGVEYSGRGKSMVLFLPEGWPSELYPLRARAEDVRSKLASASLRGGAFFEVSAEKGMVEGGVLALGGLHYGVERRAEEQGLFRSLPLAERAGRYPIAQAACYSMAAEEALGVSPPLRGEYLRAVLLEAERALAHVEHLVRFLRWLGYSWSEGHEAERLLRSGFVAATGSPLGLGAILIGGVAFDISGDKESKLASRLSEAREKLESSEVVDKACEELSGVCKVRGSLVEGATGVVARACGAALDVRVDEPYAVYSELKKAALVESGGDLASIMELELREAIEAMDIAAEALRTAPAGAFRSRVARKAGRGLCVARVESPGGEHVVLIETAGGDRVSCYRAKHPYVVNAAAMLEATIGLSVEEAVKGLYYMALMTPQTVKLKIRDKTTGEVKLIRISG